MADSAVAITPGSGANIDTRTTTGGDHRQVMVPGGANDADIATFTATGSKVAMDVNFASSGGGAANVSGSLTGSGTSVAASVANSGNGTIAIATVSSVNVPVIMEATVDGTNWFPIDVTKADGNYTGPAWMLTGTNVYAWNYIATGYTQVRVRQTAAAGTQGTVPVVITQGPFLFDPSPTVAPIDGTKDTYTAYVNHTGNIAGDIFRLSGSATKLIRVTRVEIIGIAGAATASTVQVIKRSTANSGGTTAATTQGAADSVSPAASASSVGYTVAPTPGTTAAILRAFRTTWATTGSQVNWDFNGGRPSKCPILRGTAEGLAVNVGTALTTSANWTIVCEWTEEPL